MHRFWRAEPPSGLVWEVLLVHRLAYNGDVAAGQLAVFQGASEAPISESIRVERATRKNSQLAAAHRVALKMGRRLRCSSVTYRFRYAPSNASPARTVLPRPILNATTPLLYARRYTGVHKYLRFCNLCDKLGTGLLMYGYGKKLDSSAIDFASQDSRYGRFARSFRKSKLTCGDITTVCNRVH
jgi:hypothetical protein